MGLLRVKRDVTVVGRCLYKDPETNILPAWALPTVNLLEEHSGFG